MRALHRRVAILATLCFVLGIAGVAQAAPTATDVTVTGAGGTPIAITIFKPSDASATAQVPMILHSHGWGGSRSTAVTSFTDWLNAGFGVTSIDQRGHGASGGEANVQDPALEAQDIKAVIDYVATLDWVRHDVDGDNQPIANDPVLGAIGGSYGGGYQTMTALTEISETGKTRFNALSPQITWYDLPESLAPQGAVRTLWVSLLYAAGASMVPPWIHETFVVGTATGTFPDGTVPGTTNVKQIFYNHSPRSFADRGIKLNIPVLIGQGTTDNLFNLNQGLHNFQRAVTPEAQSKSLFVAYNGGHVLPQVLPLATNASSNACTPGGYSNLERAFYAKVFAGQDPSGLLPGRYNLATNAGNACLALNSLGTPQTLSAGTIATTTAVGAPVHYEIASGPMTLAGIPKLRGNLTAAVLEARAFFGLSIGTSPADAQVIQNNMMPLRSQLPSVAAPFEIELPGIAAQLTAGQKLFLTVTPVADMFVTMGSRVPGAMLIEGATVEVPRV